MTRQQTLLVLTLLAACARISPPAPATDNGTAARLHQLLLGRYDSQAQAQRDPEFKAIALEICAAEAPSLGQRVLYVEQAVAETRDQPYRQRLYVVEPVSPDVARSRVFELKVPAAAVGACSRADTPRFAAAEVEERLGCEVTLSWRAAENTFVGATTGTRCASSLRGASYATSEVRLDVAGLVSWDRGYDAAGVQVWGATQGPYEFVRLAPAPGPR